MRGRPLRVAWQVGDTAAALKARDVAERRPDLRPRLHALWLVRVPPAWKDGGVEALVWDNAPSHRAAWLREVRLPLLFQPPYAPELNPAERLFEELRRAVEGHIYATIEDNVAAIDAELDRWDADPDRVRRLAGWDWIHDAFTALPAENAA